MNGEQLASLVSRRRQTLSEKIATAKPIVLPVAKRFAHRISKDKLGYADPGSQMLSIDEEAMTARFVVTTSNIDRDGDIVVTDGIELDEFRRNPVVLFAHGQDPAIGSMPVGRCIAIERFPERLEAVIQFDGADPQAMLIYSKVKRGYLNSTSIGFMPLEGEELSDAASEYWYPGVRFDRSSLLEISIVPTPANSEAIVVGRSIHPIQQGAAVGRTQRKRKQAKVAAIAVKDAPPQEETPQIPPAQEGQQVQPDANIQAILLPKAQYQEQGAAEQWAKNHGFDVSMPVDQPDNWAFVQFAADECQADSADSKDLGDGVMGVTCTQQTEQGTQDQTPPAQEMQNADNTGKSAKVCGGACGCGTKAVAPQTVPSLNLPELADLLAKSYAALRKAEGMNEANGQDGGYAADQSDEPAPEEEGAKTPHGHQCLTALIAHMDEHIPMLDQPKIKAFYEATIAKAQSLMASIYGNGGGGEEEEEEEEGEEGEELEETDDDEEEKSFAALLPGLNTLNRRLLNITGGVE